MFPTIPRSVAAEQSFYHLEYYADQGHDALTMEKQFAALEQEVASITADWLSRIREGEAGSEIPIPEVNRDLVSLFMGLQFPRTADTRELLSAVASSTGDTPLTESEHRMLHVEALWDDSLVRAAYRALTGAGGVALRGTYRAPVTPRGRHSWRIP